jgi:ribosomal protein L16 Arg81 hydroxylase
VIEELLGLSREQFVASYLGQRPYFAAAEQTSCSTLSGLSTASSVQALLPLYNDRPNMVSLARDGDSYPAKRLANGGLDLEALWSAYHDGESIVLNSIFRVDPGSRLLCERLSLALGHRVQANMYLTPPSGRAFATHYDTHDVMVVQLLGSKQWQVFEPPNMIPPLPRRADPKTPTDSLETGQPALLDLARGSALYLPRGYPHKARTDAEPSIHVTFSLNPVTLGEVLRIAIDILEDRDAKLRQHVSADLLTDRAVEIDLGRVASELIPSLQEAAVMACALETLRKRLLVDVLPAPIVSLRTYLDASARVRACDHAYRQVQRLDEDRMIVSNGIKAMELTGRKAALLCHLLDHGETYVHELQSLYGESVSRVVLKLSSMGIVRVIGLADE